MNKQELIKEIKGLEYHNASKRTWVDRGIVLDLIEQLDEPQKVTVPQFVADWYEENKVDFEGNLFRCIDCIPGLYDEEELNDFEEWVIDSRTKPFQTLVNMHQFGYTVEEEKRYYVRLKGVDENYNYLNCIKHLNAWCLTEIKKDRKFRTEHTKEQLEESGLGWVFDCPGIEIEEVE